MGTKCTVNFGYSIGDNVKLKEIPVVGKVVGLSYDAQHEMIRVIFWHNGRRYSKWVYPFELIS